MKKRSKILTGVMAAVLAVSAGLMGCSGSGAATASTAATTGAPAAQSEAAGGQESTPAASQPAAERKIVVGVSQCHMNTPYRVALKSEMENIIKEQNLSWELIFTDGQNNPAKQTNDVEDLIAKKVDVIIMSPTQSQPLAPVARKVIDAGIPLILVDRTISTEDYTTFVGGDNKMIGTITAEYFAEQLSGKGNIVMMQGTLGASATLDREIGFKEALEQYPDMNLIVDLSADYKRDVAMKTMEDILQANKDIQAVFCMSDNMALGALQATDAAGRTSEMLITGADGQKETFDKIKEGKLAATVLYPTGAAEAFELAKEILDGKSVEKINLIPVTLVTPENVDELYDSGF
ncbi:substrate-binding domain-containing protein [Lacrimispora sp.]|uniref:substrate-binding domain-containing protein n=1 Tax=Lacrimispora sp. TaxID=2719234 RepID=UPI0028AB3819|nr:substrate-binding domain-containing protein [Lacrimispora sp.]